MASIYDRPDPNDLDGDYGLDGMSDYDCLYCGMPCEDASYVPYCGPICALEAERDSADTDVEEDY